MVYFNDVNKKMSMFGKDWKGWEYNKMVLSEWRSVGEWQLLETVDWDIRFTQIIWTVKMRIKLNVGCI